MKQSLLPVQINEKNQPVFFMYKSIEPVITPCANQCEQSTSIHFCTKVLNQSLPLCKSMGTINLYSFIHGTTELVITACANQSEQSTCIHLHMRAMN